MDAPKCKICGERHYGLCPSPTEGSVIVAGDKVVRRDKADTKITLSPGVEGHPIQVWEAKFDRTSYQREYMRKWRAKRKAVTPDGS